MADELTAESFTPHKDFTFTVHLDDDTVALTLLDVSEYDHDTAYGFSVLFGGPSDQVFSHGTYTVEHSALGTHELALGPVVTQREADDEQHFEAVFSRLKEPLDPPENG